MADAPTTLPRTLVAVVPISAKIAKDIDLLLKEVDRLRADMVKIETSGALTLARAFVVMHRLKDKFDQLDKAYGELFRLYKEERVPAAFEAEGVTSAPLAEGFRVGTLSKMYASILPGMKDKAYQWLREHGLGDLISSTVNSSSLSGAAKHEMEENNVEFPTDIFNTAYVPSTSVTAIKK